MISFLVLIATFLLSLIVIKLRQGKWHFSLAAQIAMSVVLLLTAIGHFLIIEEVSRMMPFFVPLKRELIYLIGVWEILLAIGLLIPGYKHIAAWLLILFFVLVLPTTIKSALENITYLAVEGDEYDDFNLWFGVPWQLCLILWVYFSTLKKKLF